MDSILTSIKKLLGIDEEYEHFDQDIIIGINTTFSTLFQMGIGPTNGLIITDKTSTWKDFIGDKHDLEAVKTLVYLKVKLIFDTPSNSFLIESMNKIISELEWRLSNIT